MFGRVEGSVACFAMVDKMLCGRGGGKFVFWEEEDARGSCFQGFLCLENSYDIIITIGSMKKIPHL